MGSHRREICSSLSGTLILDATCAPQNISYPQDVNLLNEAREKLEKMIDIICYEQNYYKPRMYRQKARKDYLNLAKCKKRTAKKIRKAIKAQLQYMYDNKVHSVPDRIVSISQPYIRPIVRRKAKAPVEFGAKLDLSIDENGIARVRKIIL